MQLCPVSFEKWMMIAQHNNVIAVDIVSEKVDLINDRKSPIQDEYIKKYLAEKQQDLTAPLMAKKPTNELSLL